MSRPNWNPRTIYEFHNPDGSMLAWIEPRPHYCDRGRFSANLHISGLWISDADPWPRYYFDLEAAKREVVAYLQGKKVNLDGATWKDVNADEASL